MATLLLAIGLFATLISPASAQSTDIIKIASFDGAKDTTYHWKDVNGPVMGGRSKATFTIKTNTAVFSGVTAIVPSLKAPPAPLCWHEEDVEDHKCFEACSTEGKFVIKGINQQGTCGSKYNTVDTTKPVLQCPDGVTNVRYCAATALNVTIATKGEAGEVTMMENEEGDDVTLYKIQFGNLVCDQATLDKKYESYAVNFAGFKEGTCSSVGCSVADGTGTMKVPFLGDITIHKFTKGTVTVLASAVGGDDVTLYKISGDECGQATLDKKYESYAIKFAGLKEGTCSSVGYSVADGTKTLKVPVLGDITIKKFKKGR